MRVHDLSPVALAAALLFWPCASRADVYDFSFTGPNIQSDGSLITSGAETNGAYLITGITGTYNSKPITALLAPGAYPAGSEANDDLLTPLSPYLDYFGVSFVSAGQDYNLYYLAPPAADPAEYFVFSGVDHGLTSFRLTPAGSAPVPEPASLGLLGLPMVLPASATMRRRRVRRMQG